MTNPKIVKGIKFFAVALPLMFIAPTVLMAGLSARRGGSYLMLIIGIVLCAGAFTLAVLALRNVLNGLFEQDEKKNNS